MFKSYSFKSAIRIFFFSSILIPFLISSTEAVKIKYTDGSGEHREIEYNFIKQKGKYFFLYKFKGIDLNVEFVKVRNNEYVIKCSDTNDFSKQFFLYKNKKLIEGICDDDIDKSLIIKNVDSLRSAAEKAIPLWSIRCGASYDFDYYKNYLKQFNLLGEMTKKAPKGSELQKIYKELKESKVSPSKRDAIKYIQSKGYEANINGYVKAVKEQASVELIDKFIEAGVDPRYGFTFDNQKTSILYFAILSNDLELVKYLVSKGASVVGTANWRPLISAASVGNIDIIKYLIKNGANPHESFQKYGNLITIAAGHGQYDTIAYLKSINVKTTVKNEYGDTPLEIATGIYKNTKDHKYLKTFKLLNSNVQSSSDGCYKLIDQPWEKKFPYKVENANGSKYRLIRIGRRSDSKEIYEIQCGYTYYSYHPKTYNLYQATSSLGKYDSIEEALNKIAEHCSIEYNICE